MCFYIILFISFKILKFDTLLKIIFNKLKRSQHGILGESGTRTPSRIGPYILLRMQSCSASLSFETLILFDIMNT